jgi:hypothetical protein
VRLEVHVGGKPLRQADGGCDGAVAAATGHGEEPTGCGRREPAVLGDKQGQVEAVLLHAVGRVSLKPLAALVAKARLALEQARAVQVGQARATAEEAEAAAAAEADCRRWRSCVEGARCILTHGLCGTSIVPHCYH